MKDLLGGKGANLAEMASIGLPVPPGFTLSTEVCTAFYDNHRRYPDGLDGQVREALARVEKAVERKFGDPRNPLLVSVRSGARVSMPGMMDTVLNLGLNDDTVEGLAAAGKDARFAWDSYRRFIQMYGSVVLGVDHHRFEEIIEHAKLEAGVVEDTALTAQHWQQVVEAYKDLVAQETGKPFPQDPQEQLWGAIGAVFGSWMNHRAITYRRLHDIPAKWGTAVNVQAMVYRQHGHRLRHRRVLHPRPLNRRERVLRRVPGQRAGRGRGGGHPHAATGVQGRRQAGRDADGSRDARGLCRAAARARDAGEALPRHAGPRIHRAAGQAVHAADAQRQAYLRRVVAHGGGHGARGVDRPGRGGASRQSVGAGPVASPDARSTCAARAARQGPAGQSRRRLGRGGVQRRRGGEPRRQGRGGDPGSGRDQPGGHPRHARRPRHPDHPRGHDQPRRGGGARHGPALRRRRRRPQRGLQRTDAVGRRQDRARRRDHHAGWHHRRGVRRLGGDGRARHVRATSPR